jgi:hypothetical protein
MQSSAVMGTYRERDPLTEMILREQAGVLETINRVCRGEAPARELAAGRAILRALAAAESAVLYPAFGRVTLRLETERLLEDCQDNRARQEEILDALVHKRSPRLRKLKAVELIDQIQHHATQLVTLLIPVLRSQLARTLYGAVANAFAARYTEELTGVPVRSRAVVAPTLTPVTAR